MYPAQTAKNAINNQNSLLGIFLLQCCCGAGSLYQFQLHIAPFGNQVTVSHCLPFRKLLDLLVLRFLAGLGFVPVVGSSPTGPTS